MGRLVCAEVEAAPDLTLAWAGGRSLPDSLDADVIVDFSTPDGLRALLARAPCPVVSGTTGVTVDAPPGLALLHAPNFSLGVAVLADLVRRAHAALPGWEVEIVELHHSAKRDAPSGTALRLAEGLGPVVDHHPGLREPGTVGVHAVRGGDVVGDHIVMFAGDGERVELVHKASSRDTFARGALRAAEWIMGKPAGLYTMSQVPGL